jgi:hypothetical protein
MCIDQRSLVKPAIFEQERAMCAMERRPARALAGATCDEHRCTTGRKHSQRREDAFSFFGVMRDGVDSVDEQDMRARCTRRADLPEAIGKRIGDAHRMFGSARPAPEYDARVGPHESSRDQQKRRLPTAAATTERDELTRLQHERYVAERECARAASGDSGAIRTRDAAQLE